jgi:hypothetical protein
MAPCESVTGGAMCPIISRALDTTAAASVCVKQSPDGFSPPPPSTCIMPPTTLISALGRAWSRPALAPAAFHRSSQALKESRFSALGKRLYCGKLTRFRTLLCFVEPLHAPSPHPFISTSFASSVSLCKLSARPDFARPFRLLCLNGMLATTALCPC